MIKIQDYEKKFRELLKDTFLNIYLNNIQYTHEFIQDPIIIFNLPSGQKYIIRLADSIYNIPELSDVTYNNTFKTSNELLFGGNFISTPPNINIDGDLGLIITTKTEDMKKNLELDKLLNFLRENINDRQKIIPINCSFQHLSGSIHIDELLCPMPYKLYDVYSGCKMDYKIWIYKIEDVKIYDTNIRKINEYKLKNSDFAKKNLKKENNLKKMIHVK